jgi:hypothetical protein
MSVITMSKRFEDVVAALGAHPELPVVVLGCDKCAKTSGTGGAVEVRTMRERLAASGLNVLEASGLVDAVEEGLCDPQAVPVRLGPLAGASPCQVLVLSCGAGLKCVRDAVPGTRLVPGLDTLGPGVKGDLACLACGDCRFDEGGCRRVRLAEEQAWRLAAGYPGAAAR